MPLTPLRSSDITGAPWGPTMATSPTVDAQLDLQADVLRQLWYAGHATPLALRDVLEQSLPQITDVLDELARRGFIFQFIRGSTEQHPNDATYCLTRAARRRIETMLSRTTRYRLRRSWDALRREELIPLIAS